MIKLPIGDNNDLTTQNSFMDIGKGSTQHQNIFLATVNNKFVGVTDNTKIECNIL